MRINSYIIAFLLLFFLTRNVKAIYLFSSDDSLKIVSLKKDSVTSDNYLKLAAGDVFPDIILYDTNQNIVPLDSIFKDNKGVIFVTGSYTCPFFRGNTKAMNQMVANQINTYRIYFVYLSEAHPTSGSPYGKRNDNAELNLKSGILIDQQQTIQERIVCAKKAVNDFNLKSINLVDNEKNEFFWKIFSGPNGFLVFSPNKQLIRQEIYYNQPKKVRKKNHHNSENE